MKSISILIVGSLLAFSSCKKEETLTPADTHTVTTSLTIDIGYMVDGSPITFDTIIYTNQAGNNYSVTRLQYYISNIKLIKTDGTKIGLPGIYYVDSRILEKNKINFANPLEGNYSGIEFLIGLDSSSNISGSLPNTLENLGMAWPEPMGGGYHFMKMEGYFINGSSSFGYAMHLGNNGYTVSANAQNKLFQILHDKANTVSIQMNINDWYKNPHIYDFNIDGNYSMGNIAAMTKLAENGVDVFNN